MLSRSSGFLRNHGSSAIAASSLASLFSARRYASGGKQPKNSSGSNTGDGDGGGAKNNLESMARLADSLPPRFLGWEEFAALCGQHGVADPKAAAAAFAACGVAVTSADGVHGHAPQALRDVCASSPEGKSACWEPACAIEQRIAALRGELATLRPAYEVQLAKCVSARRRTWAGFFAFTGVQLAVFARLTYFDLDWDTMEPVSYFLGSGISLLAFVFTLLRGFDFGNRAVDKRVVQSGYLQHPDVAKYMDVLEEIEELETAAKDKTTWVRTGKIIRAE